MNADELADDRKRRGEDGQLAKLEREGHGHCREAKRLRALLGVDEEENKSNG